MTLALMKQRISETTPRFKGRMAAVFYLLTILTGVIIFFASGRAGFVVDVIAGAVYLPLTAAFYLLTKGT